MSNIKMTPEQRRQTEKITAEEFVRNKIREKYGIPAEAISNGLSAYIMTADEAVRWAHEFASLRIAEEKRMPTVIDNLWGVLENIRELNMNNYNHEEVRALNDSMIEIYQIVDEFRSRMTGENEEPEDKSISIDQYMEKNPKLDPHEQDDDVDDTMLGLDGKETWLP
jgi:hypothetical protein